MGPHQSMHPALSRTMMADAMAGTNILWMWARTIIRVLCLHDQNGQSQSHQFLGDTSNNFLSICSDFGALLENLIWASGAALVV